MQKLFSMFPNGAPGLALLMLRLFVGAVALSAGFRAFSATNEPLNTLVVAGLLAVSALALVVGLLTPIAGVLTSALEVIGFSTGAAHLALPVLAPIVIAVALALLGPGAYSLDARIFGRRLMEFRPHSRPDGTAL